MYFITSKSYLDWVEVNFSDDENKIFGLLEELLKFFVDDAKFKQDRRYICKWIQYVSRFFLKNPTFNNFIFLFWIKAGKCRDPEEVLLYMEENKIGTEYSMLYENLANIYESEGNYEKAEVFLQSGLTE